ncbi:hypothetical protein NQ318_002521 [Aromia moschata]|uniref:SEC7 domain-containing protein n=1 Tax=Aromia moschata TaxID=1265417 RepID=A0AAV8Y9N5_9CUCU|nr:hypothetical protein NQ318_002521 [Aromia moschata]
MERSQIVNSMGSSDHIQEQTYIQAPSFAQSQNYGNRRPVRFTVGRLRTARGTSRCRSHSTRKALRNGDVLKRSRVQSTYELSQDILDKQIEVLERKYGGVKARNAALTIQRAFRRYTLLKKFAAITAMAKAEKRISRRLPTATDDCKHNMDSDLQGGEYSRNFEGHDCNSLRVLPVRSMSLRRKEGILIICRSPRSQSGTPTVCWKIIPLLHYNIIIHRLITSLILCAPKRYHLKYRRELPSISSRSLEPRHQKSNGLTKSTENGSLSSVQSSGSDSSISTERIQEYSSSPIWKRKGNHLSEYAEPALETSLGNISNASSSTYTLVERPTDQQAPTSYKISETIRKRQYRVGLNLFNKKPERGIAYLIRRGFLENSPQGVARFLISRKGLSKQMIGEYLGNLQNPFCMAVLECFARELDLSGMQVDCNVDIVARLRSPDTIFVLAFAIIMLNTDLHTPNIKPERRMKVEDFIKNLRGIDDCGDIDTDMLVGVYERVKANEFKPGSDHQLKS